MPSRFVTVLIVVFWLASFGWFAYREWFVWMWAEAAPPFTVELADEAAPQFAQWSIWRGDKKIGSATTRMAYQKDDSFELQSTVEKLDLEFAGVVFRIPRLTTTQNVTREGQLRKLNSAVKMEITFRGQVFMLKGAIDGVVQDGKLLAHGQLSSDSFETVNQELDPIPIASGSIFNPMQPAAKLQVRPGQRWKITDVNPLTEALMSGLKPIEKKYNVSISALFPKTAKTIEAEVLDKPQDLMHKGHSVRCHVVEYKSGDATGRIWVQVGNGKVLRQEAVGLGEKLLLERED